MNEIETKIKQLKQEHQFMLSKISHEIRNPVTLINSFLQLLSEKKPEVTECEYWDDIMDNMDYLKALLDELSSYNNSYKLNLSPVYMDAFLEKVAASVRPTLTYLDIELECRLRHPLPMLEIDEIKLRQALLNLIRNSQEAIDGPGKIQIEAYTEGPRLFLRITDNGCGIPEEYLDTLFDPFITHKTSGTGLGLAITKNIVEAHKGQISVESLPQMTAFTLCFPIPEEGL
ncbi:MAG: sensor histidine kinase [Blautia sp.]|jgi:signal transduction histidine kinase